MFVREIEISELNIMHYAKVDFASRMNTDVIFLVQYDRSLPIVEVELFFNGLIYVIPENAEIKVRWGKRDHTYIYKDVIGCNPERTKVYFDIDEQMTYFDGEANPILELRITSMVAGSSYIPVFIDRNPIQNGDYESAIVYPDLEKALKGAVIGIFSDDLEVVREGQNVSINFKNSTSSVIAGHIITEEETNQLIDEILGG